MSSIYLMQPTKIYTQRIIVGRPGLQMLQFNKYLNKQFWSYFCQAQKDLYSFSLQKFQVIDIFSHNSASFWKTLIAMIFN